MFVSGGGQAAKNPSVEFGSSFSEKEKDGFAFSEKEAQEGIDKKAQKDFYLIKTSFDEVFKVNIFGKLTKDFDNFILEVKKNAREFGSSFTVSFEKFEQELQQMTNRGDNLFKKFSAKSALSVINSIKNIGNAYSDLFTKTIPNFLTFFLEKVVLGSAKVLIEFEKQRKKLQENYNHQRADLIESLKRNEISYFDFFDKLEDLQEDNNKSEVDLEKEKRDALTEQLKEQLKEIANLITGLSVDISSFVARSLQSIPALLDTNIINPITGLFSTISKLGKGAGDILGSIFGEGASGLTEGIGSLLGGGIGALFGGGGAGAARGEWAGARRPGRHPS
jgi:hypothetical protein